MTVLFVPPLLARASLRPHFCLTATSTFRCHIFPLFRHRRRCHRRALTMPRPPDNSLRLTSALDKDALGGYVQTTLRARHGYHLAVYTWAPASGIASSSAVVFLLHGVLGHSTFEWLSPDANNHRVLLKGSLVERLLALGVTVVAHDHPGHGRSSGLHGYVDSHDHLRDCAVDVVEAVMQGADVRGKPKYMVGMSMGGTTAIRVAAQRPQLLDGMVLVAPAVRPPDDMFGAYGRFLRAISPVLGWMVPKLPVLKLPRSPDPVIADAVQKDGLMHRGALRVQMGMEFLRVYSEIDETAHDIRFKRVAIFIGLKDNIVSPAGIESFVERIQSDDKKTFRYKALGHEVLREAGCEVAREQLVQWIEDKLKKEYTK